MPLTLTRLFTANPTGRCDPLESKEEPFMASLESIDFHFQYQSLPCNFEAFLFDPRKDRKLRNYKTRKSKKYFFYNGIKDNFETIFLDWL